MLASDSEVIKGCKTAVGGPLVEKRISILVRSSYNVPREPYTRLSTAACGSAKELSRKPGIAQAESLG